jgi:hypothetical protein
LFAHSGGVAYALLKVGLHLRAKGQPEWEGYLQRALSLAQVCLRGLGADDDDPVSFFCGAPGALSIVCVASHALGNIPGSAVAFRQLLKIEERAMRHSEDELLFGRAGYLYCVQWVGEHTGLAIAQPAVDAQSRVASKIVERGREIARRVKRDPRLRSHAQPFPLLWLCFQQVFLGAAHGLVGVLSVLSVLYRSYPLLSTADREDVDNTLNALLRVRSSSGNLPSTLGERADEHVHWCHGAPGLPSLLAVAVAARGDLDGTLRRAAEMASEVVWRRGVLLKGFGLCHGISGSGYAFLSSLRLAGRFEGERQGGGVLGGECSECSEEVNDEAGTDLGTSQDLASTKEQSFGRSALVSRAAAFTEIVIRDDQHSNVRRAIATSKDPQRRVCGVPDSPSSLMEGDAGVVCFLLDACEPERAAFPGWDV